LVSSDVGCTKWPNGDLFKKATEVFGLEDAMVLHIGDNEAADGECSQKAGFDFYAIWSAYHMVEMSSLRRVLVHVKTLEDSILLGIWMEHLLNSPFALYEKQGHLYIQSEYDVGFTGYGALATAFVHWLIREHHGKEKEKILFLARDGYLLEQLYRMIISERNITDAPEGLYVLASRRALAVPAIKTAEDLEDQLQRLHMKDVAGDVLERRFGVKPFTEDEEAALVMEGSELQEYIRKHITQILAKAKQEREDYLQYLKSLRLDLTDDTHILIDSQTGGTSAYYWRKFIQEKARLEAIMLMDITEWSVYNAKSDRGFLETDAMFLCKSIYSRAKYLNDCIFTAPYGQLVCINGKNPEYFTADVEDEWNYLIDTHQGIKQLCKRYMQLTEWNVKKQEWSTALLEDMLSMLYHETEVDNIVKNKLTIRESFTDLGKSAFKALQ